ncbi:hypothetical protein ACTQ6A_05965 [Lachnospiraceae bacterium LCP25S3_G4]
MGNKVKELQKQNNKLDKRINSENQEVFTDMICYIRGADISDYNQELVRRDLTEMMLSAQERGENIHHVIGGDFKEFCDNVIANIPPKTMKEKLLDSLDSLCVILSILGTINIVFSKELFVMLQGLSKAKTVNYNIDITIGTIISTIIILIASFGIVKIIMKHSFQKQSKNIRILKGFLVGGGIMAVFLVIAKFGEAVIFSINIFLAIVVVVALFAGHKLLSKI